jgi:hypothetical protein
MRPADGIRPTWKAPGTYGYPEAVQAAGTVVAPLLAGFSISLTVLVIDRADAFRWPDLTLLLLVSAAASLIGAIQSAYSARQYHALPEEIEAWHPGRLGGSSLDRELWEQVRKEQWGHAAMHARWTKRFRVAYHLGIILVLLALAALLVPPCDIAPLRWAAIGVALAAALGETIWVAATLAIARWDGTDPDPLPLRRRVTYAIVPRYQPVVPPDLEEKAKPPAKPKPPPAA